MKDYPFKTMDVGQIIVIPYDVKTQKYVHVYGQAQGKIFRTKQVKKGMLTITRML